MKNLKQLSRKEMKSLTGAQLNPNESAFEEGDVGCGCVAAFCVTDSNKDGSKYCSASNCC
ncbi:bacteriocin-like protein [Chryseobacterium sp. NFX27]|uniref:bacteriocin-like protein n=1 Tax=Chryseobacterium sp. NFX27 TaxID=2819618 RepID=UPI003CFA3D45